MNREHIKATIFNINGAKGRKAETIHYLTKNKPDVLMLQETRLKHQMPASCPIIQFIDKIGKTKKEGE